MSAGDHVDPLKVNRDLSLLAPKFRISVEAAVAACRAAGLDAKVFEAYRSQELQAFYYSKGRTLIPPTSTVTNAPTNLLSWHGYGLAVDVVSEAHYWKPPEGEKWFAKVAQIFKQHDCKWGGDWKHPDTPHFQWAACRPSPSPLAQQLILTQGFAGVWRAVGAIDP
jgi:peptidoglycan L-alanyl-D-glutamate endopeptidase CwlK